jgi:hypothetical protein
MFYSSFIYSSTLHTNQEVVLVIDKENEYILTESIIRRRHVMLRMRQYARLENGRKVVSRHFVNIRLGSKHR